MSRALSSRYSHVYSSVLLLALHSAFTVYINSNYLKGFLPENVISVLYTVSALEVIIGLVCLPRLIRRFGTFPLFAIALVVHLIAIIGLATSTQILFIVIFFILYQSLASMLYFFMDIYLENAMATENQTGRIRSNHLTLQNSAFLFSPLIVGRIVTFSNYQFVYYCAAVFVSLLLLNVVFRFRHKRVHAFKDVDFAKSVESFHHRKGLVKVFSLSFMLFCFYAAMVIFMPLYLHQVIGFEVPTILTMFTFMLLPFVLFEAPLGRLFDKVHKEHNAIIIGFAIMATMTLAMFKADSKSIMVWALLLFLSRIGASFVEVGVEYAFFKRVDDRHPGLISVFRLASPLAYVTAPLIAGVIITALSLRHVFLVTSIVMLCAVIIASSLNRLPHRIVVTK